MGNSMAVLKHFKESKFKRASSGIGEEMAYQYAVRKVRLFLCARSADKLEKIAAKCRALGSECEYARCDVTKEADCKSAVERCIEKYGGLDLLVVNAGIGAHVRFEDVTDMSVYEKLMQTNFFGYLYPTKYAFEALKKNKGQILVISSASGEVGLPMRTAYCASKFAVTGFFEALRIETQDSGVDITIVCPPSVDTPLRDNAVVQSHNKEAKEEKRIPAGECVENVLIAADRKARKVYFPTSIYMGTYVRPFLPWVIDDMISKASKL